MLSVCNNISNNRAFKTVVMHPQVVVSQPIHRQHYPKLPVEQLKHTKHPKVVTSKMMSSGARSQAMQETTSSSSPASLSFKDGWRDGRLKSESSSPTSQSSSSGSTQHMAPMDRDEDRDKSAGASCLLWLLLLLLELVRNNMLQACTGCTPLILLVCTLSLSLSPAYM